jgi:hypothetical protein
MKTQLIRNLSVALLAASSMFAQEPQKLIARVPFGFHVGKATLPPGQYMVFPEGNPIVLRVMSRDATMNIRALAQAAEKRTMPTEGKLVFIRYGDEYFLSEVWRQGDTSGNVLPKSRREREMAANARNGVETIIAAK